MTPGRVSQWISEGKLSGDAIVGTGRSARIDESLACAQLEARLDASQREANGRRTTFAEAIPLDDEGCMEIGRLVARIADNVLPELAAAVAAEYRHSAPDVLATLRRRWREVAAARQAEAGVPPALTFERRPR